MALALKSNPDLYLADLPASKKRRRKAKAMVSEAQREPVAIKVLTMPTVEVLVLGSAKAGKSTLVTQLLVTQVDNRVARARR